MTINKQTVDDNDGGLAALRHYCGHVLANAILNFFGKDNATIANDSITNEGFYIDFELLGGKKISENDLPRIEEEMNRIIKEGFVFNKKVVSIEEATKLFETNKYKLEELDRIKKNNEETIFYYSENGFFELYNGQQIDNSINVGTFKLLSVAGAYWKGDENNQMLSRIYGTAFKNKEELNDYLNKIKLRRKMDHRVLGKKLDLFYFSDLVGPGLPLYTPKGTVIKEELQKYIEKICRRYGFEKVMTPHLSKLELYEISGHADKFKDELFKVSSSKKHKLVLKPIICPHHTQIYALRPRSYRDLPIRYMESEKQYRAEKPGEIGGLNRVYAITIEDGHSFCRRDQVKDEIIGMVNIIKEFYSAFGLWGDHKAYLSVRDYDHPEKYIGVGHDWNECEKMLEEVSEEMGLSAKRCEGEAALYGPKLDFMFKDAMGREFQIPTVQLDFATAKRFSLVYTDKDGKERTPVMVHRAVLGSYERLIALLLENFAGALPIWLSPVQIKIIPISEKQNIYSGSIKDRLFNSGLRVEIDDRPCSMQAKIRKAQVEKIPYMLIIGNREVEQGVVSIRMRDGKKIEELRLEGFIKRAKAEIEKYK